VSFPSTSKRVKGILELVNSDVFGLVSVPSMGNFVYYVSFIEVFSRNTWIYFLRKKFEVLGLKNLRLWWKTRQRIK